MVRPAFRVALEVLAQVLDQQVGLAMEQTSKAELVLPEDLLRVALGVLAQETSEEIALLQTLAVAVAGQAVAQEATSAVLAAVLALFTSTTFKE
jgi:hypothetical protein